ncbi:hypothetical protein cyc_03899 [Cyclospora cayetanensis]|uniref:ELMO domain-containing protein n=1 Tax=Cyclospora cayetanensis TaxID=88456 RepID=A0A1D3CUI3_9EIME|nr:hypothetical protein cyc_03899 [Cyclospora cayetanensis]
MQRDSSSSWAALGFQCPVRDFRFAGRLCLDCLYLTALQFSREAKEALQQCKETRVHAELPFALTHINVTSWLLALLNEGILLPFFLHSVATKPLPLAASGVLSAATDNTAVSASPCLPPSAASSLRHHDEHADNAANMTVSLLQSTPPHLVVFSLLQTFAFLRFVNFWQHLQPSTVMHFNAVSTRFREALKRFFKSMASFPLFPLFTPSVYEECTVVGSSVKPAALLNALQYLIVLGKDTSGETAADQETNELRLLRRCLKAHWPSD